MSHAWPAGSGGQNTNYVSSQYVNYPMFVMSYWFANNIRAGGTGTTTTTAGSGTTTTAHATTTTTQAYSQYITATVTSHYVAGRLTVTQYNQMGAKYGYNANITLYKCGTTWTNSPTCGPLN
jgi:poly(3-hydroxybutyrate) depolymerase